MCINITQKTGTREGSVSSGTPRKVAYQAQQAEDLGRAGDPADEAGEEEQEPDAQDAVREDLKHTFPSAQWEVGPLLTLINVLLWSSAIYLYRQYLKH